LATPLNDAIEEGVATGLEAARQAGIASTRELAPGAEKASTAFLVMSPAGAVVGPEGVVALLGASAVENRIAVGSKILNTVLGGNDFTTSDIVGDAVSIVAGRKLPKSPVGGATASAIDKAVETLLDQEEDKKKN